MSRRWVSTCLAPRYITSAPTTPRATVEQSDIRFWAAMERMMFRSRRSAPAAKTRASVSSAWYPLTTRMPPSDSVRWPVTSALIRDRSREMGRDGTHDVPEQAIGARGKDAGLGLFRVVSLDDAD